MSELQPVVEWWTASEIADAALPVSSDRFKYTVYPISEAFNTPDARVSRKGAVKQLEFSGTEVTSDVMDYGLDSPIPQSDIDVATSARAEGRTVFDPEARATEMLTETLENIRELRVAQTVFASASYAPSRRITLSGTSQFSDFTNSDPIGVLTAGMDSTLVYRPNTVVLGREVWGRISSHPKIVNAVKGNVTNSGRITIDQFRELLAAEVFGLLAPPAPITGAALQSVGGLAMLNWALHPDLDVRIGGHIVVPMAMIGQHPAQWPRFRADRPKRCCP